MGIGNGQWIARYRGKASRPMRLNVAKRYAIEMVKGVRPGITITDPIDHLNRQQLKALDDSAPKACLEPKAYRHSVVNLSGVGADLTGVVAMETGEPPLNGRPPTPLKGDDCQLECYPDGYPKLPACLDSA
jgi:hypothetical protein